MYGGGILMKRKWLCFLLAVMVMLSFTITAQAADEKIDKVTLTVSYEREPKTGDAIGSVAVKAEGNKPYTVDEAYYTNEGENWIVGDRPVVMVQLTAKSGYRFAYNSKSHFSLSGGGATFKRARIYDDGLQMELEIYLKRIGGVLSSVENLEWSDTVAYWDGLEGAKSYEVKLYRDERSVTTVETTSTNYNFANYLNREGTYTFRVRAISSYNDRAGEWSDYSEDFYLDEDEVVYYGGGGTWQRNQRGWWYAYSGGGYPRSCWKQIDNSWYYFDGEGYMATGWRRIDGETYYLGIDGSLKTGWQAIDGSWYYLDASGIKTTGWQFVNGRWYYLDSNGIMQTGWQKILGDWYYLDGSGAMLTGWQVINGNYYYFGGDGKMYTNRWTPDGFYVDINGIWLR